MSRVSNRPPTADVSPAGPDRGKSTQSTASARGGASIHQSTPPARSWWIRLKRHLHALASATGSLGVHLLLVLILMMWLVTREEPDTIGMTAEIAQTENAETVLPTIHQNNPVEPINAEVQIALLDDQFDSVATDTDVPLPVMAVEVDRDNRPDRRAMGTIAPKQPRQIKPDSGGLAGRSSAARGGLAARFGGNAASEMAVENGLKWLINHQFPNGSWRLQFDQGPCKGQCGHPATRESTTAATGLTLMALLGAGYTHQSGPYQQQVQQGLDYLKSRMRESAYGGNLAEGTMYAQGIATIALSEAYAMTKDETLLPFVESAIKYIVTAQHEAGGWRYNPGQPGDITVTGWQLMALKSAQMAGIDPPIQTLRQARQFLADVGDDSSGLFGYQDGTEPDPTSTSVGLLLQLYQGWSPEHRGLIQGTDHLIQRGPSRDNIYFNYYATQVLFHCQHQEWDPWNREIRDHLVQTQARTGHEAGSWFFPERYGSVGGRLYTTAMAILILEVYYRYLPLYDRDLVRGGR